MRKRRGGKGKSGMTMIINFKGSCNNRERRTRAVATGAYFRNEMRDHNQILGTN